MTFTSRRPTVWALRPALLRAGDVLVSRKRSASSCSIQICTRLPYSHVSVARGAGKVVEAMGDIRAVGGFAGLLSGEIRVRAAAGLTYRESDDLQVMRLNPENPDHDGIGTRVADLIATTVGQYYSGPKAALAVIARWAGERSWATNWLRRRIPALTMPAAFCSEIAARAYQRCGVDVCHHDPLYVLPGHFSDGHISANFIEIPDCLRRVRIDDLPNAPDPPESILMNIARETLKSYGAVEPLLKFFQATEDPEATSKSREPASVLFPIFREDGEAPGACDVDRAVRQALERGDFEARANGWAHASEFKPMATPPAEWREDVRRGDAMRLLGLIHESQEMETRCNAISHAWRPRINHSVLFLRDVYIRLGIAAAKSYQTL